MKARKEKAAQQKQHDEAVNELKRQGIKKLKAICVEDGTYNCNLMDESDADRLYQVMIDNQANKEARKAKQARLDGHRATPERGISSSLAQHCVLEVRANTCFAIAAEDLYPITSRFASTAIIAMQAPTPCYRMSLRSFANGNLRSICSMAL